MNLTSVPISVGSRDSLNHASATDLLQHCIEPRKNGSEGQHDKGRP